MLMRKKNFILALVLLLAGFMQAAQDNTVTSLSPLLGKPIRAGAQIKIQDQWYNYMLAHQIGSGTPYTSNFMLGNHSAQVVLRYDDAKRYLNPNRWGLQITYSIVTRDEKGNQVDNLTGQILEINYNPLENTQYTDKALKLYNNCVRADLTVTCVKYYSGAGTFGACDNGPNPIPAELSDIYLDLQLETERFYNLDANTPPQVQFAGGFTAAAALPENQLPLSWNFTSGSESYDLEWLFIDAPNQEAANNQLNNITMANADFDFRNATRVNVPDNHYNIPMAFPSGILLYRVRANGYKVSLQGNNPVKEEISTYWSHYNIPSTSVDNTVNHSANEGWRYDFAGLKTELNWSYSVSFAEDGKRSEGISFSDGLGQAKQSVALINSDHTAVISETKNDYEGRPVAAIMPSLAPAAAGTASATSPYNGLTYYNNFAPGFDKSDFDTDAKLNAPDGMAATDNSNVYYGSNNNATGIDAYIPDAQGYAYSRTRFCADGTNRVRSVAGVGPDHKMGSGHETRFYYSHPTDQKEIDRLFGNEAGYVAHYQKNMVRDANGQVSLSYLDQEGRTVATCLAGNNPGNLLPIDNRPAAPTVPETHDLLGSNQTLTPASLNSSANIIVTQDQTYQFEYLLNASTYCETCVTVYGTPPNQVDLDCPDCLYDISISVTNEDGVVMPITISQISPSACSGNTTTNCTVFQNNVISGSAIHTAHIQFSAQLSVGQYSINKTLTVNQAATAAQEANYIQFQNLHHTCVEVPLIAPVSCNSDCYELCEKAYKITHPDGSITYIDDNGLPITGANAAATAQALIDACRANCNSTTGITDPDDSPCAIKLAQLKKDMSPGGQYFDNSYAKYLVNIDANNVEYTSLNPAYNMDAWLNSLDAAYAAAHNGNSIFPVWQNAINSSTSPAGTYTITTAADLRSNWQTYFADVLVNYHPEFAVYAAYCTDVICGRDDVRMTEVNTFEQNMQNQALAASPAATGYMNPTNITVNSTFAASDLSNGNINYITAASVSGISDPLTNENCGTGCTTEEINSGTALDDFRKYINYHLSHFYPVSSTNYLSIWYVLDDPLNLHSATETATGSGIWDFGTGTTTNAALITFFKNLHTSIANTAAGKYQFFLSNYSYYRQLYIYTFINKKFANQSIALPLTSPAGDLYSVADGTTYPKEQRHFLINYPRNSVFDVASTDLCNPNAVFTNGINAVINGAVTQVAQQCTTGCQNSADEWMAKINTCLSTGTAATVKQLLTELCTQSCITDGNLPAGTSTSTQAVTYTDGSGAHNFYSFDDIIAYFGCSNVHLVHPAPLSSPVECACNSFKQFDLSHYVAGTSPTALSDAALATELNAVVLPATYTYVATDIAAYRSFCSTPSQLYGSNPTLPANFPAQFNCAQTVTYTEASCNCTNLDAFILAFGFDPAIVATKTSTDPEIQILVAHLNSGLQLDGSTTAKEPVTAANFISWLGECHNTNTAHVPSTSVLYSNRFPETFKCPEVPANATPAQMAAINAAASCVISSFNFAVQTAANSYFNSLHQEAQHYQADYQSHCLEAAVPPGKQSFTGTFLNYEYHYTLYYYDQAGNLIKTVPPEGFEPLTSSNDLAQVQSYRAGTAGVQPKFPAHRLITNYKYSTLNQVIEQSSPDGGLVNYWYDNLGRLILSQNDKQRVTSAQAGNTNNYPYNTFAEKSYSYTRYDELGRIEQVGELRSSTDMSWDLAFNKVQNMPIATWFASTAGTHRQVTSSYYDVLLFGTWQHNLRNRVASVTYSETEPANMGDYSTATHYSYDIHGNVNTLASENRLMPVGHNLKYTHYVYDLVSGNTNEVHFQPGEADQLSHRYFYDADNRLVQAQSSHCAGLSPFGGAGGGVWEKEAKYFYYATGALARSEIGDKQVSGQDYAYTIQGWLKGLNSNYLNPLYDIGKDAQYMDGALMAKNLNANFAADAAGFTLGYFNNDYKPKKANMTYNFETTESYNSNSLTNTINGYTHNGSAVNGNLYNGNISRMVTALYDNNQNMLPSLARAFFYDQLNRIKAVKTFDVAAPSTATGSLSVSTTANDNYYEDFSYDFNGNLTSLNRYGLNNGTKTKMDEFQYKYLKVNNHLYNNRLMNVNDNTALTNNYTAPGYEDIDNQDYNTTVVIGTGDEAIDLQMDVNYEYDNIGNLAKNRQDKIERIEWTVYGKVHKVIRSDNSGKVDLEYIYNPFGQRVGKIAKPDGKSVENGGTDLPNDWVYTFYELDASGNTMSVYEKSHPAQTNTDQLLLNEQYLYGASRVGVYKPGIDLLTATASTTEAQRVLGKKAYQISNHLGNVLQTISDRKLNLSTNEYHSAEYFEASAHASTATAYEGIASDKIYGPYPQSNYVFSKSSERKQIEFGDYISAGIFSKASSGINLGQLVLSITDANGATVGWIAQPLTNGTTSFSQTTKSVTFSTGSLNTTGTAPYYITCFAWNTSTVPVYVDYLTVDIVHHGSLQELAGYGVDVISASDYYAFGGGGMPGRTFNSQEARHGFNGQEKDDEIANGMYTAEFWEYDSRIGRRWNIDPIEYEWQSPYATFNNDPVYYADPKGLEGDNDAGNKDGKKQVKKGAEPGTRPHNPIRDLEEDDKSPKKHRSYTITIGNAGGPWAVNTEHPWVWQTPFSDRKVTYYNTRVSDLATLTEPAYLAQFQWTKKDYNPKNLDNKYGVLALKQKMNKFENTLKFEATTHIDATYSKYFHWYDDGKFSIRAEATAGLGLVLCLPEFEDKVNVVYGSSIGLVGNSGWKFTGGSVVALGKINATYNGHWTLFVALAATQMKGWNIKTSQGLQSMGNIGAVEVLYGASIRIR